MKPVPALFSVLAVLGTAAAGDIRGRDPALAAKYTPSAAGTFTCLDGSATIPFSAVNDDYCDCADGSDEPGTSACEGRPAAWFFCENRGHIPARIRSGRVNDGLCEPECCDGSDEWASPGKCPNTCAEVSKVHRAKIEAEQKTRRTGAKIRSSYVGFAHKEKKRLEEELEAKQSELVVKEEAVAAAQVSLEKAESQNREEVERKKQSPLFQSMEKHRDAVRRLQSEVDLLKGDLKTLVDLLDELSKGYNPNGQDMAVKYTVAGYKDLAGKVDVEEASAEATTETADGDGEAPPPPPSGPKLHHLKNPNGEIPGWEVDSLLRTDIEALLVSEDDGDDDDDEGLLYRLEEYIPDSLFDYYDTARDSIVEWLTEFGVLKRKHLADGPHVSAARDKHRAAEREAVDVRNRIRDIESTLDKLSGPQQFYGPQGEWKKLDGTCIDTVMGDYTYELCFFGGAKQKSNKDHSSNNLGTFAGWGHGGTAGEYAYYTKQQYRNGAKCWNGPNRAVNVEMTCGTTNAITSVTEPEKCEYKFKVTTPALCWPLEGAKQAVKEEQAATEEAEEVVEVKDEL